MKVSIRKAVPTDAEFVRNCAERAYAPYVDRMGMKPAPMVADFEKQITNQQIDIVYYNSAAVGFVVWFFKKDCLFVENIALNPNFKGKGLARQVFDHLEQSAKANNQFTIELYTNEKMTENLALYPHLGFKETGRRTENSFARVYFRKTLT